MSRIASSNCIQLGPGATGPARARSGGENALVADRGGGGGDLDRDALPAVRAALPEIIIDDLDLILAPAELERATSQGVLTVGSLVARDGSFGSCRSRITSP